MNDANATKVVPHDKVPGANTRESLSSDSADEEVKLKDVNYSASKTPYVPFPAVINAYQSGARMKTFILCGEDKKHRLLRISVHLGLSGQGPLGTRPGIYLHNGTSTKDAILAAAGDEDQWSQRVYVFNNKSVIIVPHLLGDHSDGLAREWVTELMVASTTRDDAGVSVIFRFAVNSGPGDMFLERETFGWRKFKTGSDKAYSGGGYKLLRLSCPATGSRDNDSTGDADHSPLAVMELNKGLAKYLDHMYTLSFVGLGLTGDLGGRWKTMVVVTAARLWIARLNGKTNKTAVSMAERVQGKSSTIA
ncbi:hypothetical protein GE09DRAFT_1234167 [Coniochaeta sp. 2T2.1]|nr:hypothetical protein GE09DRAFT_1234167 [Coniochaeta sp. 2T2.1]